jgi:hypothetical protein
LRKIILPLLALLFYSTLSAQFKLLGESQVFEENENGQGRILLMKDKSTVFFQTTKKMVEIRIYDAKFKQKVVRQLEPEFFQKKRWEIESIFEVSGNVVLMVNLAEDKTPKLIRVIIDGKKGNIIEEKQVAELLRMSYLDAYAMAYGGVPVPDFFVRKDPYSDNYVVAMLNSKESDRNKRIEIIWFGADNKEINHAYYASPENKYKYMEYVDMAVVGTDLVSILVKAYNTRSSGGEESELLLGKLVSGSKDITASGLEFSKDMVVNGGIVRYNKVTKRLILLSAMREKRKSKGYIPFLAYVNPADNKVEFSGEAFPTQASLKSVEIFGKKQEFTGMPQNIYINDDGSFAIAYEEIIINVGKYNTYTSYLGNLAIANYSIIGSETGSYFIPKSHTLQNVYVGSFYKSETEGKTSAFRFGNQYKKFAYLDGAKKTYLLFNDIERNAESVKKGKITSILGVGECDGYYFDISGDDVMPERKYVFGKPEEKKMHNLAIFGMSDYNREQDIFVTLKLENDRGDKGVKLVWLQPQ